MAPSNTAECTPALIMPSASVATFWPVIKTVRVLPARGRDLRVVADEAVTVPAAIVPMLPRPGHVALGAAVGLGPTRVQCLGIDARPVVHRFEHGRTSGHEHKAADKYKRL